MGLSSSRDITQQTQEDVRRWDAGVRLYSTAKVGHFKRAASSNLSSMCSLPYIDSVVRTVDFRWNEVCERVPLDRWDLVIRYIHFAWPDMQDRADGMPLDFVVYLAYIRWGRWCRRTGKVIREGCTWDWEHLTRRALREGAMHVVWYAPNLPWNWAVLTAATGHDEALSHPQCPWDAGVLTRKTPLECIAAHPSATWRGPFWCAGKFQATTPPPQSWDMEYLNASHCSAANVKRFPSVSWNLGLLPKDSPAE